MTEPLWISLEQAQLIHDIIVSRIGGALGIRDISLLESAINRPVNFFHYKHGDIFQFAASNK